MIGRKLFITKICNAFTLNNFKNSVHQIDHMDDEHIIIYIDHKSM